MGAGNIVFAACAHQREGEPRCALVGNEAVELVEELLRGRVLGDGHDQLDGVHACRLAVRCGREELTSALDQCVRCAGCRQHHTAAGEVEAIEPAAAGERRAVIVGNFR